MVFVPEENLWRKGFLHSENIEVVKIVLSLKDNKTSAVAEMGDRSSTIDMRRKLGAVVPLFVGELGNHLTQCGLDRGLPPHQVASYAVQPFGHNTPTLQT